MAASVPAGGHHLDARDELLPAVRGAGLAGRLDEPQLILLVGGDEARVVAQGERPFVPLGHDARPREGRLAGAGQKAAGVVPVEVADRDGVDRGWIEAGLAQGRQDGQAAHPTLRDAPFVEALADARLDQHATGRRLDEQAVECLGERGIGVQLIGYERLPDRPWHRSEGRSGIGREPAGLDERDPDATAQVRLPIDAREVRHERRRVFAAYVPRSSSGPPLTARRSRSKSR